MARPYGARDKRKRKSKTTFTHIDLLTLEEEYGRETNTEICTILSKSRSALRTAILALQLTRDPYVKKTIYSPEFIREIFNLKSQGKSYSQISKLMHISRGHISKILNKKLKTAIYND